MGPIIEDMRRLAVDALARMYLPADKQFVFHIRRTGCGDVLEGTSRRYTAIALIGLADEGSYAIERVLAGSDLNEVCSRLINDVAVMRDLGEVALAAWAARRVNHPRAEQAVDILRAMRPAEAICPTVELAWSLMSLVVNGGEPADKDLAAAIASRLMNSFSREGGLFPHYPVGACPSRWRAHVGCYADLVYPIQALSWYHRATGNPEALDIADRCACRMCELQGAAGQWWWHYDVRTGVMLEKYPVYAIHQDAMGPMCLFAVEEAGGRAHHDAIVRSVRWLVDGPELTSSLIDRQAGIIWRKVARREPNKLVRKMQAGLSAINANLRVPLVDWIFPPGQVDWESRPYHMGWILHAFTRERLARLQTQG